MKRLSLLAALVLLAITPAAWATGDSCLSPKERQEVAAMYKDLRERLEVDAATERLFEALDLRKEALSVREKIQGCQADTLSRILPSSFAGCNDLIERHNALVSEAKAIEEQASAQLDMFKKLSSLNRQRWRSCD
jgi:hypothetical protein